MKLTVLNNDAANISVKCDLILTDPPYELPVDVIASVLNQCECSHAVMLVTFRQAVELLNVMSGWGIAFDFVFDNVQPRKSKSIHTPHYTHSTGIYIKKIGVGSIFNRKLHARTDSFMSTSYWPTIIRANRERSDIHSHAKNIEAWRSLMCSFEAETIYDPFAGSGTTLICAAQEGKDCIVNDISKENSQKMKLMAEFYGD